MSKRSLRSLKNYKKSQNYDPTDHGVKWLISKMNEIRDLGVEIDFLCYVSNYVFVVYT